MGQPVYPVFLNSTGGIQISFQFLKFHWRDSDILPRGLKFHWRDSDIFPMGLSFNWRDSDIYPTGFKFHRRDSDILHLGVKIHGEIQIYIQGFFNSIGGIFSGILNPHE